MLMSQERDIAPRRHHMHLLELPLITTFLLADIRPSIWLHVSARLPRHSFGDTLAEPCFLASELDL
jgi:hypothetical protein